MEQRRQFIQAWQERRASLSRLCREWEISRPTAYKWIERYEREGDGGLENRSRTYGLPKIIWSDNGSPFASKGLGGLSRLSVWWIELGIVPERIAPGRPQQNGRVERLHRTLKAALQAHPARTGREPQRRLDFLCREYNEERPHEALGQIPPGWRRGLRRFGVGLSILFACFSVSVAFFGALACPGETVFPGFSGFPGVGFGILVRAWPLVVYWFM